MKQQFLISSLFLLFAQQKIQHNETASLSDQGSKKAVFQRTETIVEGDVTITSSYLTDAEGYNYGAVFYIHNTNNYSVGVKWWFEGSVNVRFSPESSGRMVIPAKTTGVLLTSCSSADRTKAWNSGTPKYDWSAALEE